MKLLEQLKKTTTTDRAADVARYAEMLRQPDVDTPEALAEMQRLMAALDLTPDDVARHAAAVGQDTRLERQLAEANARTAELDQQSARAGAAFDRAQKALWKADEDLKAAYLDGQVHESQKEKLRNRQRENRTAHPLAFGVDPTEPATV